MKRTIPFTRSGHPTPLHVVVAGAVLLAGLCARGHAAQPQPGLEILQDLRSFNELASVLCVAAHPDDENTQLIAYLARGRGYRTAYLSLTRGDGGQNVLGPEFGDLLGVIRTQELLAARRVDGGEQFFTRARDFGYSKDYRQTLDKWGHRQVLGDVVRVIREFRPDVIITRFSTLPGATHGHHTASAVLALEAFKISGDPAAFPEQLGDLAPWQAKRIVLNGFGVGFRRAGQLVPGASTSPSSANAVRIDISGNDPVLGVPLSQIAARSRSMHKTQGFGNFAGFGGAGSGPRYEQFQLLAGDPMSKDFIDGVDISWNRVPGGAEIGRLTDQAIAQFDPANPAASVPALLEIRSRLAALAADPLVSEKRLQLDRILQASLGLDVQTVLPLAEVVPGETLNLRQTAVVHSDIPVRWVGVRYPSIKQNLEGVKDLLPNKMASWESSPILPTDTPLTQPYWLREEGTEGLFRVDNPLLIGRPENPPPFPVELVFNVGGQTLVIPDQPVQAAADPERGETHHRMDVIAPASLAFGSDVELFAPGSTRPVTVEVTAFRAGAAGTLLLDAPAGWKVEPATQSFHLPQVGAHAEFSFNVTAPPQLISAQIIARAQIDGTTFSSTRMEIRYPHIPVQLLQPPARLNAVSLDLAIRGHQVGYLPGAGDQTSQALQQMGYAVTQLSGADLTPEKLQKLDAVVIGIRAFNVRTDLAAGLPALFAYVEAGGNVIAQYNTPNDLKTPRLAPFDIKLSRDLPHNRVTDENAPVTLLVPDHPAFTTPNRITAADFDGWVQERGLNFPSEWDAAHFTPLLACGDPGEAPLKSALLVARYGRGYYVYTGLSFFRQLPAGVPGAYRLLANLVSLGK
jgi:LmbE family N-acetylglucosaminyl deacetylase